MSHTPGPWHVAGSIIVTEAGQTIAQMQLSTPRDHPVIEKKANAHLVAAAPDLLGALEKTLFPLKTAALRGSYSAENAFIRAEKAIAKARGGT
jgi:hypothetical protein